MRKLTIEIMKETADRHGGRCLSSEYYNSKTNLAWECGICGYVWEATPNNIRSGKWCSQCANNLPKTLKDACELAEANGGRCLSLEYVNAKSLLILECAEGHLWEAPFTNIKSGSWCKICKDKITHAKLRGSIEEARSIAKKRGGECLSEHYENSQKKLLFKCLSGHPFEASLNKVKNQSQWCPSCKTSKGESICRVYLEHIFQKKFPKSRPKWLKINNQQCELDGYNEDLKIGFEHHGAYHFEIDGYYSETEADLKYRQQKDLDKIKLCHKQGVKVLVIPEIPTMVSLDRVGDIVLAQCSELNIDIPCYLPLTQEIIGAAFDSNIKNENLATLQDIATKKGGACLALIYLGFEIKLPFICSKGHHFSAIPQNIFKGHWCPQCAGNMALGLETAKEFAAKNEGSCASPVYVNVKANLEFVCKNGTHFFASLESIRSRKNFCLCTSCKNNPATDFPET